MRWKVIVVGLLLGFAATVGCSRQCYLSEPDYYHYTKDMALPPLDCGPGPSIIAATSTEAAPATVADPERKIRYLSLAEAIAIALEQGTTGFQNPVFTEGGNVYNDTLTSFAGGALAGTDNIRVLALDPAIVGANIEVSLSKFDALWQTSMTWTTTDQPISNNLQAVQSGAATAVQTEAATVQSSLLKPLPAGGVAGITFLTNYTLSTLNAGRLNPTYQPILQFQFEQPLLQGYGVEINELRVAHPNSILTPFQPVGNQVEGIVITRLRFDEQRAEFERNVNYLITNAEIAYWNLYFAYWNLYSNEQALRQAYEAWRINKARYEAGRIAIQDFAQTRQQYELFRAQRLQALGSGAPGQVGVLEAERQLRGILGMPVEDGTRLVPADQPTLAPYRPDWNTALNEALALRPEIVLAREDLKFRQLDLMNQKNLLLPDMRFFATYDINALGDQLDGGGSNPNNALANLAKDKFNDWEIGLRLNVPIGFRAAHSQVRQARLNLARSYLTLRDQELRAERQLCRYYRRIYEYYDLIQAQRAQREAAATQLDARFKEFLAGRGTLDILLEAQRVWAAALSAEYQAIATYNQSLAEFEQAKGTILQHDNVIISEGPLPHCAQVRAVDHEQERSKALVAHEQAQPVIHPIEHCADGDLAGVPQLPANEAPSLPSLLAGQEGLEKVPTQPLPRESDMFSPPRKTGTDRSQPAAPVPVPAALEQTQTLHFEKAVSPPVLGNLQVEKNLPHLEPPPPTLEFEKPAVQLKPPAGSPAPAGTTLQFEKPAAPAGSVPATGSGLVPVSAVQLASPVASTDAKVPMPALQPTLDARPSAPPALGDSLPTGR